MTTVIRRVATADLADDEIAGVRRILWAAFDDPDEPDEGMTEEDWEHALGGVHLLLELDGALVGHASVVERELQVDGRPLRTGYVEAVAIDPGHQRSGFGSTLMADVGEVITESFELGALGTGSPIFYERLGWLRWAGPTYVRAPSGLVRTDEEDGGILVLPTPRTPFALDLAAAISCEWRSGDVW